MDVNDSDAKLKILLVMPSIKRKTSLYDRILMKFTMWQSLTLYQIASLCGNNEVKIIDENYEKIIYGDYDLVAISTFTATAPRAYEIADKFMEKGAKVVLGGYHPTALPEEAKQHAHAVVIGNAEGVWHKLLDDISKNSLKPFYFSPTPFLSSPDVKRRGIINGIEATRGCPYRCKFCSISNSEIGNNYMRKPVEQVVKEIEKSEKYFVFYDSSLTIDAGYTKSLFNAIKPLNKKFACFGNINVLAKDKELLRHASEAGCIAWAVGMESFSPDALKEAKKKNDVKKYRKAIKLIHEYNMDVVASLVFGFDSDDKSVFEITLEKLYDIEVDSIGANILTPFPGTPLFEELKAERRILTYDWEKYDLYHIVFIPKRMSQDELLDGVKWLIKQFFSYSNILARFLSSKNKIPMLYHLVTSRLVYRNTYGKCIS